MRADYDSEADALGIDLVHDARATRTDEIDDRCRVAMTEAREAVAIEILRPSAGIDGPLATAAARHDLDLEALLIAARAALAAPDREIIIEVGGRSVA